MPKELAALGYTDLSLISATESFLVYRALTHDDQPVLAKVAPSARPSAPVLRQLEHELEIARELNPEFVVRPLRIERSDANSWLSASGVLTMRLSIVGIKFVMVIPSSSIIERARLASKERRNTCRPPTQVIAKIAQASARWNIGAA